MIAKKLNSLKNGFALLELLVLAAIIAILVAMTLPARAFTVPTQNGNYIAVTNQPAIVTTGATSNIMSWVKLTPGKGLALSWIFNQSAATTSNATLNVFSSVDGTNISTVPFASLVAPSNGTTNVIVNTNFDLNKLVNFDSLVIGNIANTSTTSSLTNKAIIPKQVN